MRLLTKNELEDFINRMSQLSYYSVSDIEVDHTKADEILVSALELMGYAELTKLYEKVPKWYA